MILAGRNHTLIEEDPLAPPKTETAGSERIVAPVPGRIARVFVQPGDAVEKNAQLIVVEAMKMELLLRAPHAGTVAEVRYTVDEMVKEGTEFVTLMKRE